MRRASEGLNSCANEDDPPHAEQRKGAGALPRGGHSLEVKDAICAPPAEGPPFPTFVGDAGALAATVAHAGADLYAHCVDGIEGRGVGGRQGVWKRRTTAAWRWAEREQRTKRSVM